MTRPMTRSELRAHNRAANHAANLARYQERYGDWGVLLAWVDEAKRIARADPNAAAHLAATLQNWAAQHQHGA